MKEKVDYCTMPITRTFIEFLQEITPASSRGNRGGALDLGTTLCLSTLQREMSYKTNRFFEGEMGDAEEFLTCLLNQLKEEALQNGIATPIATMTGFTSNLVTDNGLEEFVTLPLNVFKNRCKTLQDILIYNFCDNEDGACSSKISHLPEILYIQMKLFKFSRTKGVEKITKKLSFPSILDIPDDVLDSSVNLNAKQKKYKLHAVVYHEGYSAEEGHYTSIVYNQAAGSWIHFDDSKVEATQAPDQEVPDEFYSPYLLVYRRKDTFNNTIGTKKKKKSGSREPEIMFHATGSAPLGLPPTGSKKKNKSKKLLK